ncbi:MAG TPA: alpha/beta hydrolase [Erysipelotrichaceae bacterium]|nr:alpha/beta hydrolase [Erysipelotrichaceae bacterium]
MICRTIPLNETAHLDTYILNNSNEYNVGKKRPFVLVLPGGAYAFTSDREAEPVALRFNSIGCHAGVLWYTTRDLVPNVPRNAFEEAMMAVKWVREHAEEYLIHTDQIIVCGFSAGGHLAIECATMWHESWIAEKLHCSSDMLKINLAIPCYAAGKAEKMPAGENGPMMLHARQSGNMRFFGSDDPTDEQVEAYNCLRRIGRHTPPMFIWHTYEDQLVDVSNSIELAWNMKKHAIPFELHIFEKGEHGLALADRTTARKDSHKNAHVYHWFELCEEWLSNYIDIEEGMYGELPFNPDFMNR